MTAHGSPDVGVYPVWDARLETGVATLDLQHRVLFEMVRRTREAGAGALGLNLGDLLQQLRAYADYHFRYEEDWIRRHARHALDDFSHAHLHAEFAQQLDHLEARLQQGALELMAVRDFLQDWLVNHILRQDLPMVRALLQPTPPAPG